MAQQVAFIFANGDVCDGPMVRRALQAWTAPAIIAADGGARVAGYYGYRVDTIIGDMDSLTPQEINTQMAFGAELKRHPPEKDATDLELALQFAVQNSYTAIRIIGGLGDRFDQTLANVYLLALPELSDVDVCIVAGKQEIRMLRPGDHIIYGQPGDTLSLIPVGGDAVGIRTAHLYYPLDNETLTFGPARGVSNVLRGEKATISLRDGLLLCIHTLGRA
mgnify:CR=1 FL=1